MDRKNSLVNSLLHHQLARGLAVQTVECLGSAGVMNMKQVESSAATQIILWCDQMQWAMPRLE